jgi:hypothetical protein
MSTQVIAGEILNDKHKRNFRGITLYFSELRIDRDSIPKNMYCYGIRHADNDWTNPITIEPTVMVNHYGDIITEEPLVFENADDPYITIKPKERAIFYETN